MILAGIDEAGYGPVLAPPPLGCCAFEIVGDVGCDAALAPVPCLWKALRTCVSKKKSKNGRKLHVNDSKLVYSPSTGLKELERSVLALSACAWNDWDGSQHELLSRLSPRLNDDVAEYPWYAMAAKVDQFPFEQESIAIRLLANALRQGMGDGGVRCVHLCARVVLERELNRMIDNTRNKGAALFSISACHIDHLLRHFGDQGMTLFCDRQGGREHYGSLLRQMFEEWSLEIIDEQPSRAEYRLHKNGAIARMIFCEKAEKQCMAVAYASMISKYLRESLMRRFNAYWKSHLPDVTPTAGYYKDGLRFLTDIDAKRRELGIEETALVRCR
jgi:ribonuclease HII